MKKSIDRIFVLILLVVAGVIVYVLGQQGLVEAISTEVQRYGSVIRSHIYIVGLFAVGGFPVGWIMGKLRTHS